MAATAVFKKSQVLNWNLEKLFIKTWCTAETGQVHTVYLYMLHGLENCNSKPSRLLGDLEQDCNVELLKATLILGQSLSDSSP